MKYNLSRIMSAAWELFRKLKITFSEALHRAWLTAKAAPVNTKRIEDAKTEAGITEDMNIWAGWKAAGFEGVHGSKALFGADLIYGIKTVQENLGHSTAVTTLNIYSHVTEKMRTESASKMEQFIMSVTG